MSLRIILPLCIAGLTGAVSAQLPQCDISERECLDELISSQCMSLESDTQSCSAFRELLTHSPQANQPTIRAHVGASYLMQAARAPNQNERRALISRYWLNFHIVHPCNKPGKKERGNTSGCTCVRGSA